TEAEAIARLQHPNIVQLFEIGEHDGLPFFSLEFCPAGSLNDKLAGTPIQSREAATLVQTLALAMEAAHRAGGIHRDLKPANVLVSASQTFQPDSEGTSSEGQRGLGKEVRLEGLTCKISDFGLAKKLDSEGQTQTGAIMGTPSYMAPEQAEGRKD